MRASFVNLRLTGELLCGGGHDILTRRTRLCVLATRRHVLRSGRRARSTAGGRRVTFLGRTQANTYVNYSSLSKSDVLVAGFRQNRADKVIPHRQVIEPNM
jgi:hypothetical protein